MDVKVKALQVDQNQRPTKKGDPQIGVKTDKGWLKVSGGPVKDVVAGDVLVLNGEPQQFGKSWYGRLVSIDRPNGKATMLASQPQVQDKPTVEDILGVVDKILARLPEAWKGDQSIQGHRACAQIINTIVMGVESGQIVIEEAEPDLPETPTPSDDDRPPWER